MEIDRYRLSPDVAALGFRTRASIVVALAAALLLAPFAVLNFVNGESAVALGALTITLGLTANAIGLHLGRPTSRWFVYAFAPVCIVIMISVFRYDPLVGTMWCYPAVLTCYCVLPERQAWLVSAAILIVALPMALTMLAPTLALRVVATLLAVTTFSTILVRVIDTQYRQMSRQLREDHLTGLRNRFSLTETLEAVTASAVRDPAPWALLVLDLDHFKTINDCYGHDRGDRVLSALGELMRQTLPSAARAFRMGGEEFVVLLPESENEASLVAERLRVMAQRELSLPEQRVTLSIGVAALEPGDMREDWLRVADRRLYAAKAAGRNRVCDSRSEPVGNVRMYAGPVVAAYD